VESEVPRVKSYLGLRKAREQPESAVVVVMIYLSSLKMSPPLFKSFGVKLFCSHSISATQHAQIRPRSCFEVGSSRGDWAKHDLR
jgi:hypothetical protein